MLGTVEEHEAMTAREELKPYAYAVENDQGYIVGCWKDRRSADRVIAKGNPDHHERVVALYDRPSVVQTRTLLRRCWRG